ncbi:hypothetical protein [Legionella sp. PC997]|uniref:hypothetical protein n=1 Tax=Legionella sp. PC997 TaxID=2755562 RepID=UPI0015FC5C23|nr:hypothetical protein [Legionella sp. PC997]QMT59528.1 hypothetical protein HBNCFIEN_00894 [Legionella sp. PC997]
MSFWMFFKNKAADLGGLVTDKPQIYTSVRKLINQLDAEIDANKKKPLPSDVFNALRQLRAQLESTMTKFDEDYNNGIRVLNYKYRVKEFANECRSAIYSWEPTLMAHTGVGNKLKAFINAVLEHYFGEPYFTVEKNDLGLKKDMNEAYTTTKQALTNVAIEDPEDLPCGFILS